MIRPIVYHLVYTRTNELSNGEQSEVDCRLQTRFASATSLASISAMILSSSLLNIEGFLFDFFDFENKISFYWRYWTAHECAISCCVCVFCTSVQEQDLGFRKIEIFETRIFYRMQSPLVSIEVHQPKSKGFWNTTRMIWWRFSNWTKHWQFFSLHYYCYLFGLELKSFFSIIK